MDVQTSLLDRLLSTPRPLSLKIGVTTFLLLIPFAAAAWDGMFAKILGNGMWRILILPVVIICYCWFISPLINRMNSELIIAARSLVMMDETGFTQLINQSSRINPIHEWIAFAIGMALGVLNALQTNFEGSATALKLYWTVGLALMYGILAWIIYDSFASTRLNAAILRQPLNIDLFDITPFEVFGRHSLILAMAFIGGLTLSLLCTFQMESLYVIEFWLVYFFMALITVLIFFLGMRPTHMVLNNEKNRELKVVRRHILRASRDLLERIDRNQETNSTAVEINALAVYETRLQAAQTWPYNTPMLRTLFVSVLVPLGSLLAREVLAILLGG